MKPFESLLLISLCVSGSIANAVADDGGQAPRPAIIDMVRTGAAFQNSRPEIQEALLAIARLASEYEGLTESELLAMPNIQTSEELSKGRSLRVVTRDANGVESEFRYNRIDTCLSSVRVTQPDKSAVSAGFTRMTRSLIICLHNGYIVFPGGKKILEFQFEPGSNQPRYAVPYVGERYHALVQGKIIAWDDAGNIILEYEISKPTIPIEALQEVVAAATPQQLDASGMSEEEWLQNSRAFHRAEFSLQHSMICMTGWCERFLNSAPDELRDQLHGKDMRRVEENNNVTYHIEAQDETDSNWIVSYVKDSGQLKSATWGGLSLYFDRVDKTRLIGGRHKLSEMEYGERYWLVGFYPGKTAPRIALSATGKSPSDLVAAGKLYVWDPSGNAIVEKEITEAKPIPIAIDEAGAALTKNQRDLVGWRGDDEAKYLLGRY